MSGVDFAGDTISVVHRDRKVEVAPTVLFKKGTLSKGVRTPWTPPESAPVTTFDGAQSRL